MLAEVHSRPAASSDLLPFDETGILSEEDGAFLLLADIGGRYRLEYSGALPVGAWVRVRGHVDHSTASVSHQIAGTVRRNTIEQVQSAFDAEGELVEGRENLMLLTGDGKRYVLNESGDLRPGQRVRVYGTLIPLRVTLFDEGDGCVLNERIEPR